MKAHRILKWVTGGLEALLGIPVLGGTIVVGLLWTPLALMLVLHIITLVFTTRETSSSSQRTGSILGIVTSCVAWIPFVGMILHIITAIILMITASQKEETATKVAV